MNKFIKKIFYISLPILVIAIAMEIMLRMIPNDYLFKKEYLDNHSSEIETLILGSSHAYYGFNPEFFSDNAFNASHISQSLNYDLEILKKFESSFQNLKTVVLPISYFTLYGKLELGSESWRVKNYSIYYGINLSKNLTDYSEVFSNRFDINVKRLVVNFILGKSSISSSSLGWGTSYNSEDAKDLEKTGKSAAIRHSKGDIDSEINQQIFEDNIEDLNSIINWCKANNIDVLLLTPPAFETYSENLNQDQLNTTLEAVREICSKNDNCNYLNLLYDTRFVSGDFYDADHLSEIGAKKLSELINEQIQDLN